LRAEDLRVGCGIRFHAELRGRQNNELHLLWHARVEKRWSPKNFVGRIADLDSLSVQRVAICIHALGGAEAYCSPNRKLDCSAGMGCGRAREEVLLSDGVARA
jgi:hypothetical protein